MCDISSWTAPESKISSLIKLLTLLELFKLSLHSIANCVYSHLQERTCCYWHDHIINSTVELSYSIDVTGCYIVIYVLITKSENSSMNHRTRCMMGTLPLRGTFSQSQKLKSCDGFFLMSLVLLWQFIWIGKILLHWCYDKKLKIKKI